MKILHLEDNAFDAELVRETLLSEFPACVITVVTSYENFLVELTAEPAADLVLSDFTLPSFDGLSALALARERAPDIPFIFLSGSIGEERAISAVRAGAYDYVLKDNMARLAVTIRRALADFAQRRHHKEDERRLLELAGIIERASEAVVVSDMSGRITLWNDGAARLYGIRADEAVGQLADEILLPRELAHVRAGRDVAFETGEWQQELSITTRDERNIVIHLRVSLVRDDAGRPSARLSIATDITEQKKLEEQFLRAQRLDSLGMLAAGISHDLNNALAPVLMATEMLRSRATAAQDLQMFDILEKCARRGSALVQQILGFAKGAGGGMRLTQVKHLLHDIVEVIQASFPKSIALDQYTPGDLWPIQANPTQIHQILLNLAVNARDAMLPRGGRLRLRAENRLVSEQEARELEDAKPGAHVVLEVGDTGTGMTPEVLARIWEPFFTTKHEGKGTGLGLATVRGIAAAHGGFVTVTTRVGHGTTFRVFLPADKQAMGDAPDSIKSAPPRGHGELVLIVDDEPSVRQVAAAILTQHGYRVITCHDGREAIAIFKERGAEVQAIISDLNMPHLDGAALAAALRSLKPEVKILMITGLGSTPTPGLTTPTATIAKPFTVDTLLTALHHVLHGSSVAARR